jgi:glucose-6-phosphate 1-dehydrogenase
MTSESKQTLLILGASGDLAGRLLLPGLGNLLASGGGEEVSLVGCHIVGWDDERWSQGGGGVVCRRRCERRSAGRRRSLRALLSSGSAAERSSARA